MYTQTEWLDIFSTNLQELMRDRELTQDALARKAHLSQPAISAYIRCARIPSVPSLVNLCYALDCDMSELCDFGDMVDASRT